MKTRKTKGFPKYMTTNMNYGKNMFKFNLNHITWKKKKNKNIKYVKQKCK